MTRGSKALLLGAFGLTVYLLAESFQEPELQPSARLCGAAIDAYQAVGSPTLKAVGVRCRYSPTCSHYAEDAIEHYGTLGGILRTTGRLWRCSPWGGTGYDPAVASLLPIAYPSQQETPPQETPEQKKAREEFEKAMKELPQHVGEAGGACVGGCVVSIILSVAWLGILVFMMIYAYKDSKARGDTNSILWLVLIFFLHLIGFVIYMVARPKGDLAPCANCKNKIMTTLTKCPHCGTEAGAAAPPPKA